MQTPATTGPFFLCFSLVLREGLNIHPALPPHPAQLLLVAQTLCFTVLSPLHQGTGKFRLTLGNTRLDEDDAAGTWQGINSLQGAWGRQLFTGTTDVPRKGVSNPLPSSSAYTRLHEAGMQRRHCEFSVAAFRKPEWSRMFSPIRISPRPCRECCPGVQEERGCDSLLSI